MPSNRQMSWIQGYTFKESDNWVGGGTAGPQWVRSAPLTRKQRSQLGLGAARKVRPAKCDVVAFWSDFVGLPRELATPQYIKAAGYSKRANDNPYYRRNQVALWQSTAYVLPAGQAQAIVADIGNTSDVCTKYTVITRDGDIDRVNFADNRPVGKTVYQSGSAVVQRIHLLGNLSGVPQMALQVSEAIGDIFYTTYIHIGTKDAARLRRVNAIYNKLANNLADVAGVTRERVDFNRLTKYRPDPAKYVSLIMPSDSGASV